MGYDVIVVGASFAGLAVAAQLRGKRVLVVDRKPIGSGQTSACGTLRWVLEALGLEEAILQVHDQLAIHTPDRTFVYPVTEPYCTFDYAVLCRRLWERCDAEFVQTAALSIEGHVVHTTGGAFGGDVVVDASGWRAVLGRLQRTDQGQSKDLNFGLETTVRFRDNGLHFWYDPGNLLPLGVTWAFPAGDFTRVGIGSYQGDSHLRSNLERFLYTLGLHRNGFHGGYFPHALRDPVVDELFLVGDAAGQCMGLTGEGIRPALFFGTRLGHLLRRMLGGEMGLEEARKRYRRLVSAYAPFYSFLCLAQRVVPRLPMSQVQGLMALMKWPPLFHWWLPRYLRAFWLPSPTDRPVGSSLKGR